MLTTARIPRNFRYRILGPFLRTANILKTTVLDVAKLFPTRSRALELYKSLIISRLQLKCLKESLRSLESDGAFQALWWFSANVLSKYGFAVDGSECTLWVRISVSHSVDNVIHADAHS